jgi:hypothetical protein
LVQTLTTNRIEGKCTSFSQAAFSTVTGFIGGAIGGPVVKANVFSEGGPWLDTSIAAWANKVATEDALYGIGNLTRSGLSGIIGNVPGPF